MECGILRNPNRSKKFCRTYSFSYNLRCNQRADSPGGDGFSVPSMILIAASCQVGKGLMDSLP